MIDKTQAIQRLINELKQADGEGKRLGVIVNPSIHRIPGELFDALLGSDESTVSYDDEADEEWGYRVKTVNGVRIFTNDLEGEPNGNRD